MEEGWDLHDRRESGGASPAHHDHGEREGRDDEADEAEGCRVGVALVGVADVGDLGCQVELDRSLADLLRKSARHGVFYLLEELRRHSDARRCPV